MGTRLDPAKRQPTAVSRRSGLLLQVLLGVLTVIRISQTQPVVDSVVVAVLFVGVGLAIWWGVGKWFSLVLLVEVAPLPLSALLQALGFPAGPPETMAYLLLGFPALVVGLVAGGMDKFLSAPLIDVDLAPPMRVPEPVLEELLEAGFRARPDLVYGVLGFPTVVAVYAHPHHPMYVDVIVRPVARGGGSTIGLVSHLGGGAALETQNVSTPTGSAQLRQVFPKAGVSALARHHLEALAWLGDKGVTAIPADAASYRDENDRVLDDTAEAVRAHPLRSAAQALILRLRGRQRDTGPIQDHADVTERLGAVLGDLPRQDGGATE